MEEKQHLYKKLDENGTLESVCLSPELWATCCRRILPIIESAIEGMQEKVILEPMHEWNEFLQYWDFEYPVETQVTCVECGASTEDWLIDAPRKFSLKSAQLGGLVVFECACCHSIVRKKHFKDHTCFEATRKNSC